MRPIIGTFLTLVCLTSLSDLGSGTINPLEQEPGAVVKTSPDEKKDPILSGRVVDGLGRPLSRVNIKVMTPGSNQEETWDVILSGEDGQVFHYRSFKEYEKEFEKVDLGFQKTDHVYLSAIASVSKPAEYTMHHTIDWDKLRDLRWSKGEEPRNRECGKSSHRRYVGPSRISQIFRRLNQLGARRTDFSCSFSNLMSLFAQRYGG